MKKELIFIKKTNIKISLLRYQYIPNIFSPKIWSGDNCMSIANSPHVDLLNSYIKYGLHWELLFQTNYTKMFEWWNTIGYNVDGVKRTKSYIKSKIKSLINLYLSIKQMGYIKNERISILNKPFWISRYNYQFDVPENTYEIWHGHHRAACCYVLNLDKIPSIIYKDAKPGTKKCDKWDKRLSKLDNKNWSQPCG